jgi:hypothetical protein
MIGLLLKKAAVYIFAITAIFLFPRDLMAKMNDPLAYSQMYGLQAESGRRHNMIFGVFAEDEQELHNAVVLAESIRTFGGQYKDSPIWVYVPESLANVDSALRETIHALSVQVKTSKAPEAALKFYYARKVFASAQAENEAEGKSGILVWLDNDTVILKEPGVFILPANIVLGYRPVMHKNIGSLYSESPDEFWSRIYADLNVPAETLFPMETFTDHLMVRPYFNAGVLIVKPEAGILRKWAEVFPILYGDSAIVDMCREDKLRHIFLHQAALSAAIPLLIGQDKMLRLPDNVNYPIFFKAMYGAEQEYSDLSDVITLRYEAFFRNPVPDWTNKLQGPDEVIVWLKEHLED